MSIHFKQKGFISQKSILNGVCKLGTILLRPVSVKGRLMMKYKDFESFVNTPIKMLNIGMLKYNKNCRTLESESLWSSLSAKTLNW